MTRRRDRERYQERKQQNPDYPGFRGADLAAARAAPALESVVCSRCGRRRNAPTDSLPPDRSKYVCLRCQEELAPPAAGPGG